MPVSEKSLLLQWSDEYSVGIRQFDQQHRYLFELINDLYLSFERERDHKTIGRVLGNLYAYAVTHTTEEEDVMEANDYPELAEHRVQHKELRHKLQDYISRFEQGDLAIGLSLFVFLQEWLHSHLLNVDRLYVDFLKAKGVC